MATPHGHGSRQSESLRCTMCKNPNRAAQSRPLGSFDCVRLSLDRFGKVAQPRVASGKIPLPNIRGIPSEMRCILNALREMPATK